MESSGMEMRSQLFETINQLIWVAEQFVETEFANTQEIKAIISDAKAFVDKFQDGFIVISGAKMIEVSIAEIVLFAWAVLATAIAFKYHHKSWQVTCMIQEILSDEKLRDRAVNSWREFKETST